MSGSSGAPGSKTQLSTYSRRWRPVGGWTAGVAAGVVSALIVAWVVTPKAAPTDGLPFTVAMAIQHGATNGQGWIAEGALAEIPARPEWNESWADWLDRTGAAPHQSLEVDFTVQGRSQAQVTLTGLQVRVVARRSAVTGVLFQQLGGDPTAFRAIRADLDQEPPTLNSHFSDALIPGNVPAVERKPIVFPYEISISDAETFAVQGRAESCDCDWVIDLSWAAEGRTGTVTIDHGGKPFRVSGPANVTTICYVQQPDDDGTPAADMCQPA